MNDLVQRVPKNFRWLFTTIVELTDDFFAEHLNDEYRQLCREMAVKLCRKGTPLTRIRELLGDRLGDRFSVTPCQNQTQS